MRYIPHTTQDIEEMLSQIGVKSIEELFTSIPEYLKEKCRLNLPPPKDELSLIKYMTELSLNLGNSQGFSSFLGGGAYRHFIPASVNSLAKRGEFVTSYTPYQPEVSQGTLQAIFEYQTLICQLTGMEVSNASMYDGASSLAEAILMVKRITKKNKFIISKAVHPEYRQVAYTYTKNFDINFIELPFNSEGRIDFDALSSNLEDDVGAVVIQSPNFFGVIEDSKKIANLVHSHNILLIFVFTEALSLSLLVSPGSLGADVVVGEAQSFGLPLNFGGPYLGVFATHQKFLREIPGRIVGETIDKNGKRGYVITLATREQHIKREKATSNICTNEGLCALTASIYLSIMGKVGLQKLGQLNLSLTEYMKSKIKNIKNFYLKFSGPTFNEFVVETDFDINLLFSYLYNKKFFGGIPLKRFYPELNNTFLVNVTELNSKNEIDQFCNILSSYK